MKTLAWDAVILDMDGLMFDTEVAARRAWRRAGAFYGIALDDLAYSRFIGLREKEASDLLSMMFGADLPIGPFNRLAKRYYRVDLVKYGVPVKPGLGNLLDIFDELGLAMAVATSTRYTTTVKLLRLAGLDGRIRTIVAGDQVANGKPAPDIFLEAARRLKIAASHCLVLEDSNIGVKAASNAGMQVIMIPDLVEPSQESAKAALHVVPSLNAVAQLVSDIFARG